MAAENNSNGNLALSQLIFAVPRNQQYPMDVYKYIKRNASQVSAAKLMQICKYFQQKKFEYFVAEEVFDQAECIICKPPRSNTYHFVKLSDIKDKLIWLAKELCFTRSPASLYIPKIAVCNIQQLWLERQNLTFVEFKVLTSAGTVKKLHCSDTHIRIDDVNEITFTQLLQCLPKVVKIIMYHYIPYFDSTVISEDIVSPNLSRIALKEVQNCFYFEGLFTFIRDYPYIQYDITIEPLLSLECIQSLQAFVDEIIEAPPTANPPFFFCWRIHFKGQTTKSYEILSQIFANSNPE